jgi:carbon monoxide dehydrogenase subunit G
VNTFTVSTSINRPLQEVFDFFSDPANTPKWQNGTKSAKWISEGPLGSGSVFQTVGKLMGREMTVEIEITQYDPPNVVGMKGQNGPMKFEATNKFEPKDNGTLLTQTFKGELGGLFNLAEGMAIKQLQKQVESDGQTLKKILEAM